MAESDGKRLLLCPSAPARAGSLLVGVVTEGGKIGYLKPSLPVTTEFIERANVSSRYFPESRFRFAAPCATGRCHN